ncbi:NUDIX hydrolase [Lysobacter pythonis]|uniref:Phosphatase NudJ n=1 Tax=Solilutibacter pythonis TaxID=2483112 RepID=A0A3M2I463_9GAMM|nr:NUDIX hydrolase [Lysobacter pythonis]RMH94800.1 NUDIX hydrolase [Lysobacter pythonis]
MTYREGRFWQPDVTVATVVAKDGRLLCVEERANGRDLVINQPAGHLEPDESLQEAAIREAREETGWDIRLTGFVGAYQWKAPETGRHYLRFAFCGEPERFDETRPLDEGIVRAVWWTPAELRAEASRHRSPLVWRAVEDWLAGRRHPLELARQIG